MDPTGNSQALALAAPRQEDMGFPKPQFAGSAPNTMSNFDSGPAQEAQKNHVSQARQANDDPFAAVLSPRGAAPSQGLGPAGGPSQALNMAMAPPMAAQAPPFDV